MAKPAIKGRIQPHWLGKSLAGVVLGYTLALACVGLFAWLGPGGIAAGNKTQFTMWLIAPLWMSVFVPVYLFRSGLRAWLWLGAANIVAYSVLLAVRAAHGGGG